MAIEYLGLSEINGPLVVLEGVKNASYEEIVEFHMEDGTQKIGRIVEIYEDKAVIQVFEGTDNMSLGNTHTRLTGHPMEIGLSPEILGRTFNGIGQPIDGLGEITPEVSLNINGLPLNPVTREYPRNYINTGISAIDGLTTLIRGQKLPIFSGNGLPHDKLAAQIVQQASLGGDSDENFAIVFAAMGVKYDVAEFFRRTFEESGASDHVVMFLNLANDPVVERLLTPKIALTAAEYLAFEKGMHILVILTDITSFCEAMREVSSSKGEIPSRKGYPGYLYSELATLYERAGIVSGGTGSVTQIPILTMPNDDITHPIPDLTGYITEGQIVLDRQLHGQGIYPPINVLPSLSRLMKDGIGEGFTRADHQDVANQLFSCYAKVGDARALASVIGEDELSQLDKIYLNNLSNYNRIINQRNSLLKDIYGQRNLIETLDIWDMQLAEYGKKILERRKQFIKQVNDIIADIHYKLTGGKERITLTYESSLGNITFETALSKYRERDLRMKSTTVGPHRDDICFTTDAGLDIRKFGSQGQQRTAALSLKLSEIELVKEELNDTPILLLDDVLSELDKHRQNYLLDSIDNIQTIITCTGLDEFVNHRFSINKIFHIKNGHAVNAN